MQYYKDKGKIFFQVGLITAVSVVILFLSYGWLTRVFTDSKYQSVKVSFSSASGLSEGATVCIRGVPRGLVNKVEITADGVIFDLKVELPIVLCEGTQFIVEDIDMMGNKQIDILPKTTGNKLDLQEIHQGEVKITLTRFIGKLDDILSSLEIEKIKVENFRELNTHINGVLSQLNLLLTKMNENDGMLDQTNEVVRKTNEILGKINDENSSANKFLTDTILYRQISTSIKRVDSILIDVKANPSKYFKIEVF